MKRKTFITLGILWGLHVTYSKNPQKLYDEWIKKQSI